MSRGLRILIAILIAGAFILSGTALRGVLAVALLLIVPGFMMTKALFPGVRFDGARQLLLAVTLSIGINVLLSIALNLSSYGLRGASWAAGAALVSGVAGLVAVLRSPRHLPKVSQSGSRFRLRGIDILALVAAFSICGIAVGLAGRPLSADSAQGYTSLWMVASGKGLKVGIQSGEMTPAQYLLVVRTGQRTVYKRVIRLEPGQQITRIVQVSPARSTKISAEASPSSPNFIERIDL